MFVSVSVRVRVYVSVRVLVRVSVRMSERVCACKSTHIIRALYIYNIYMFLCV